MSRLDELINELCPNGVEFKCLGDIGQVKMCKRILKSQTNTNGGIPFIRLGLLEERQTLSFLKNYFKSIGRSIHILRLVRF